MQSPAPALKAKPSSAKPLKCVRCGRQIKAVRKARPAQPNGGTIQGARARAAGDRTQPTVTRERAINDARIRASDLRHLEPKEAMVPGPTPQPSPARPRRSAARRPVPGVPAARVLPEYVGIRIAATRIASIRERVVTFLMLADLRDEAAHLNAIEERLSVGSAPALHHAALSTRLLLQGVADYCFPARSEHWHSQAGGQHKVGSQDTGNRLVAFVESSLGPEHSSEEHRLFIALLDTVKRFSGRGPHRIYNPEEANLYFLRVLEVMDHIARGYLAQSFHSGTRRPAETR